jgi:hypothetical protein
MFRRSNPAHNLHMLGSNGELLFCRGVYLLFAKPLESDHAND